MRIVLKVGECKDVSWKNDTKIFWDGILLRGVQTIIRICDDFYKIYYYEGFVNSNADEPMKLRVNEYPVTDIILECI